MNGPLLYVENDENDRFLFERALRRIQFVHSYRTLNSGREAIAYFQGEGMYANRIAHPLPTLLVLDLKMPEVNGLDVLRWVRARPEFSSIAILVFSSSTQPSDVDEAKAAGANGYVVKPGTPRELEQILRDLRERLSHAGASGWFHLSATPVEVAPAGRV